MRTFEYLKMRFETKVTLCIPTCVGTNVPRPPDGPKVSLHSTLLHSGPIISAVISLRFTSLFENSRFMVVCENLFIFIDDRQRKFRPR